jgi:hypothetical protein
VRLQAVGLTTANSYEFPVTQAELADTLGITTVHANRMLQQLRKDGLITLQGNRLTIMDVNGLQEFAEFDPNYLHLTRRGRDGAESGRSQRKSENGDDRDAAQ